jgi:hypothetical protein
MVSRVETSRRSPPCGIVSWQLPSLHCALIDHAGIAADRNLPEPEAKAV